MAVLGIDFGSSYTTVSWINPRHGKPETVKFNGDGSVKYPSVIMGTDSGLILGYQALSYLEPIYNLPADRRFELLANFIPSLKRILSPEGVEIIGDKEYSHLELLSFFFSHIKQQAIFHCGSSIVFDSVVISHPVDFQQANIDLLQQALKNAGFNSVSFKLEPVAAVQGYSIEHDIPEGTGILVFDFGGGTIDVAYIQKHFGNLKLLCEPKGDKSCGGQDFDILLYEDLRKRICYEYNVDISSSNMIDYGMLNSCRRLKEHFSGSNDSYDTSVIFINDNKIITYKYKLNRDTFNSIICQKVVDAINVAKAVIGQTEQKGHRIDKVLLIGGSSQLTLVRNMLTELLPNSLIETCGEKDVAVALGNIAEQQVIINPPEPDTPKKEEINETKKQPTKNTPDYRHDDDGKLFFEW